MSFFKWSKSAGANAGADPSINWAEGQTPSSVNDSARAMMAAAAKFRDDIGYAGTTTGTGAAYLLATNQVLTAWQNGFSFAFIAHANNSAAATISVDGLAAKPLRLTSGVALAAAEVVAGTIRTATYILATDEVLIHAPMDAAAVVAAITAGSVPSGAVLDYAGSVAPTGYVLLSGKTIGDASSGGTERANADTSTLFQMLWNSMTDTEAPVIGGRGVSAVADFAAHKAITVPDARGRSTVGKDNMGGTAANRMTAAGSGVAGATLGASGGAETHTLIASQMPQHNHTVVDPGHAHQYTLAGNWSQGPSYGGNCGNSPYTTNTSTSFTNISIGTAGGNGAHTNTHPVIVLNKIMRL